MIHYATFQRTMETKQYNLESAEGCYSMALMYSKDVKAKYAVKVSIACHVMYGLLRNKSTDTERDWPNLRWCSRIGNGSRIPVCPAW